MARKKIKLEWIKNDAARKACLKKRRVGLLKKMSELTTLCDINGFIVICSPGEREPMMWPSRPLVQQMLMQFQSMPDVERYKKFVDHESYIKGRMAKAYEQTQKETRKNKELNLSYLMTKHCHLKDNRGELDLSEMVDLFWLLDEKMKTLKRRIDYLRQVPPLPTTLSPLPPPGASTTNEIVHHQSEEFGNQIDKPVSLGGGANYLDHGKNILIDPIWDQWVTEMMNNCTTDQFAIVPSYGNSDTNTNNNKDLMLPHSHQYGEGGSSTPIFDMEFHHKINVGVNTANYSCAFGGQMLRCVSPSAAGGLSFHPNHESTVSNREGYGARPMPPRLALEHGITGPQGLELPNINHGTPQGGTDTFGGSGIAGLHTSLEDGIDDAQLPFDAIKNWLINDFSL